MTFGSMNLNQKNRNRKQKTGGRVIKTETEYKKRK